MTEQHDITNRYRSFLVSTDAQGGQANGASLFPSISGKGRLVAFASSATNLAPVGANSVDNIFVKNLQTGTVTLASTITPPSGQAVSNIQPSLSLKGRFVAFTSLPTSLVPFTPAPGFSQVLVKDLRTDALVTASADASGQAGNAGSGNPSISASGRFVAFGSAATNLVQGGGNVPDIFVKDLKTGAVTLASANAVGQEGNDLSLFPLISPDGHFVAFDSRATNLVSNDVNGGFADVFVKDLKTGAVTLADTNALGQQANLDSVNPSISADGRFVAFSSFASNLVPDATPELVPGSGTGSEENVYVKDLRTGALTLVSANPQGHEGNGPSSTAFISPDGRFVSFNSTATDLVPNTASQPPTTLNVFVKDLRTGHVSLVSEDAQGHSGNNGSTSGPVTNKGTVAYSSTASNLVANDTNGVPDIFVARHVPVTCDTIGVEHEPRFQVPNAVRQLAGSDADDQHSGNQDDSGKALGSAGTDDGGQSLMKDFTDQAIGLASQADDGGAMGMRVPDVGTMYPGFVADSLIADTNGASVLPQSHTG